MKKRSVIWKMPSNEFSNLVKNSGSFREVLKYWNMDNQGNNYNTLKRRIKEEQIDVSHIYANHKARKPQRQKTIPLNKIMVRNSTYNRGHLKNRLIKEGILKTECSICGQGDKWHGQELVLVLDHINGIYNDHRLENLRLLCPNCNSQQPTFSGKRHKIRYHCTSCHKQICKGSTRCKSCSSILNGVKRRKVKRPSTEVLQKQIDNLGYCRTGRHYGVSDNTIRKWLKN